MADHADAPQPEQHSGAQTQPSRISEPALFGSRKPERTPVPIAAWAIAALVVALLVGGLLLLTHHGAGTGSGAAGRILPLDPRASTLVIPASGIVMSESTSLSGGKSTFIDGTVRNTGSATVTGIDAQVLFANDAGQPQVETLPMTLIRTRQPYVDVEPVSAEPLKPGETREFRFIFENIASSWNQTLPEIHVTRITTAP